MYDGTHTMITYISGKMCSKKCVQPCNEIMYNTLFRNASCQKGNYTVSSQSINYLFLFCVRTIAEIRNNSICIITVKQYENGMWSASRFILLLLSNSERTNIPQSIQRLITNSNCMRIYRMKLGKSIINSLWIFRTINFLCILRKRKTEVMFLTISRII
jgi:hypothetical protein